MEKVIEVSTAAIALGTILGMGGAIGTFLLSLGATTTLAVLSIIFYILGTLLFLFWLRRKIE